MHYAFFSERPQKSIASIMLVAILMWSVGVPTFINTANAVSLDHISDLLSDSGTLALSNHTITATSTNGVSAGETITITFPAGFDLGLVDYTDIDFEIGGADAALDSTPAGATWGVSTTSSPTTIVLTSGTGTVGSSTPFVIEIGEHATFGVAGDAQITNPAAGSYIISVDATSDNADTRVVILDHILVTAEVQTIFDFSVITVANDTVINGVSSTTDVSAVNALAYGVLAPDVPEMMAHELRVKTNAQYGYVVTVQADHALLSATGADIDTFQDDDDKDPPAAWASPAATVDVETTYGHMGITSEDGDVANGGNWDALEFSGAFIDAPLEILAHTGPITWSGNYGDGTYNAGKATTRVGYKIEISALQEAADDYNQTLWYVATPTF